MSGARDNNFSVAEDVFGVLVLLEKNISCMFCEWDQQAWCILLASRGVFVRAVDDIVSTIR